MQCLELVSLEAQRLVEAESLLATAYTVMTSRKVMISSHPNSCPEVMPVFPKQPEGRVESPTATVGCNRADCNRDESCLQADLAHLVKAEKLL